MLTSNNFLPIFNATPSKSKMFGNESYEQANHDECFEIFGLKLYFDDILIIALIIFLYNEDVKDQFLFVALLLLLLS